MRLSSLVMLLALSPLAPLAAAENNAAQATIAEFREALAGNDLGAKRSAMNAVNALGEEHEAAVLDALYAGVQDRQLQRFAFSALVSRTGARGMSSSARMDANMRQMEQIIAERKQALQLTAEVETLAAENERLAAKVEDVENPQAAEGEGEGEGETTAAAGPGEATTTTAAGNSRDVGQLDRIIFNDGGMLVAYVVSRRVDLDGNLTSIRVVHRDGAGEETLDARLIARIDEDIR